MTRKGVLLTGTFNSDQTHDSIDQIIFFLMLFANKNTKYNQYLYYQKCLKVSYLCASRCDILPGRPTSIHKNCKYSKNKTRFCMVNIFKKYNLKNTFRSVCLSFFQGKSSTVSQIQFKNEKLLRLVSFFTPEILDFKKKRCALT